MTNGSAAVLATNSYDDYGIPGSANAGRFQYTGQVWLAEVGLYHYKARAYSPTLGRFLQTDPIGAQDDRNLYAYVANDPVNASDPSGLAAEAFNHGLGTYAGNAYQPPSWARSAGGAGFLDTTAVLSRTLLETATRVLGPIASYVFLSGDTRKPDSVNHYTTAEGATAISASGYIRVSNDGFAYLTPDVYTSGAQARAKLALSSTPVGYFTIGTDKLSPASNYLAPTRVEPTKPPNVQPGGGLEIRNPARVSVAGAKWTPIGK